MRPLRPAVASACLAFLLAGCGGGGEDPPSPPPVVVERAPASGAADATDAYVTVKFSAPMDPASLDGAISVARVAGGALAGAVSASGDLATFIPTAPFPAATALRVTVSADARTAGGTRLGAPVSWTFTTAHWRPVSAQGAPTARSGHTAAWTGTEMIVWGGTPATLAGGRYDPATDTWVTTSTTGAPAGRTGHSAVWTGTEMIVWGGAVSGAVVATGGRYDPATNTWRSMSTTNAPSARSGHTAVWTGEEMIVWGGAGSSGGRYDPLSDTWTPTSLVNAPEIQEGHRALWTGSRMAVWGGSFCPLVGPGVCLGIPAVQVGGLYDPAGDTWTPTATTGAPAARALHVLAWTGSELLVWGGGASSSGLSSGGRYTPVSDAWIPTGEAGAPAARLSAHSAWTGSRLLVWSGISPGVLAGVLGDGAFFDPATDVWAPVPTAGSTAAAHRGSASVWTGSELIVWGGDGGAIGARFTP